MSQQISPPTHRGAASRESGGAGATIATVLTGILTVAAGAFLAVVAGNLLDVMRRGVLTGLASAQQGEQFLFPLPIPMLVAFLAGFLYRKANRALSGRTDRWAGIGPWSLLLIGVTAGIWYSRAGWAPADVVGSTDGVDWVPQDWALYSLEFWLAPALTVITIVAICIDRFGGRSADSRREVAQKLLDGGSAVPGKVTYVGEPSPGNRVYHIEWIVEFEAAGALRRIRRTESFPWKNPPTFGQQVVVLFDPSAPDDAERTFVSLGQGGNADEYLRKVC